MKHITVGVPDQQYAFFMELIKNLKLKPIAEKESSAEASLTASQKKTWKNIKQGFEELKSIEQGKSEAKPAEKFLDDLRREGYLE